MAEVLIVKPGAIKAADRKALRDAGVVVVEADNPHDVVFVRSSETLSSNDMVWAAMDAIVNVKHSYDEKSKERLASNLFRLILADFEARQRATSPDERHDRGCSAGVSINARCTCAYPPDPTPFGVNSMGNPIRTRECAERVTSPGGQQAGDPS